MTLRASLLRELENSKLGVDQRAELCCEVARQLESKGEYEEARRVLSPYWQRLGESPKLEGLEQTTAGEVLLRAGVLTGIIGSKNQIPDAQEKAKDLISQSLTVFESRHYKKKISEAHTELALCYWRAGEINEARDLLREALAHLTTDSEAKAKAVIRLGIVEHTAGHNEKALRLLSDHAALFERIQSHTLKGSYHTTLGNRLENLGESRQRVDYIDRALIEYAAASYHFELAEHRCYLASVENNLGFLYFKINRYEEAHEHLDRARRVSESLKDSSAIAQIDETRASVFLKQGRIVEAERAARSSVRTLEKSGEHDILAEALTTHGTALGRLSRYGESLSAFRRAVELSEHAGGSNRAAQAALAAFRELGEHLAVVEKGKMVGRGLGQEKTSLERDAIRLALNQAKGSVTGAARSLGVSYQSLAYMLATRHKDLLKYRTPVRRRPRRQ